MKRSRTFADVYSPEYLARLDAMTCHHGEHRGARYCALCRYVLRGLSGGREQGR